VRCSGASPGLRRDPPWKRDDDTVQRDCGAGEAQKRARAEIDDDGAPTFATAECNALSSDCSQSHS
jgi:hypothetical protein